MDLNSDKHDFYAAIDLGSNSFHMVIAQERDGELHVIDRHKEAVRLGAGLDSNGNLDEATQIRALDCLERFGQRLRGLPEQNVRIVGTNALRLASNSGAFLEKGQSRLENVIEIVSGVEEARLVYSGVCYSHEPGDAKRLVFDIGGGSSECIIGLGRSPLVQNSLYMGCVSYTQRFFQNGKIKRSQFEAAKLAAELELHPVERTYLKTGWSEVFGSSGTIKAIETILQQNGWTNNGITLSGLERLVDFLVDCREMSRVELKGLEKNRKDVFAGGLAILVAFFERFGIKSMRAATGGLREGLLYETYGRTHQDDRREKTVDRFMELYRCDAAQANRVERQALALAAEVPASWRLTDDNWTNVLKWASRLYEIGLSISYRAHHKHGEYLIRNSELFGFSLQEKEMIARLVRFHRRRLGMSYGKGIEEGERASMLRCIVLFRLAVLLNRGREEKDLPQVQLSARGEKWRLFFAAQWLDEHPLTVADLEVERDYLAEVGQELSWTWI